MISEELREIVEMLNEKGKMIFQEGATEENVSFPRAFSFMALRISPL